MNQTRISFHISYLNRSTECTMAIDDSKLRIEKFSRKTLSAASVAEDSVYK